MRIRLPRFARLTFPPATTAPRIHAVCRAIAVLLTLGSCAHPDTTQPTQRLPRVVLTRGPSAQPQRALQMVSDTIEYQIQDSLGGPLQVNLTVMAAGGWVRALGSDQWRKELTVQASATGRVRLQWLLGSRREQQLFANAGRFGRDTSAVLRPTVEGAPVAADTVVVTGEGSACIIVRGRIGCLGVSDCVECSLDPGVPAAIDSVRWLAFARPPRSLEQVEYGACALLDDGDTACWRQLGPRSGLVPSDGTHPPFVLLRGPIGLTATGEVWYGQFTGLAGPTVTTRRFPPTVSRPVHWRRLVTDSVLADLYAPVVPLGVSLCGRTASGTLMCTRAALLTDDFFSPVIRTYGDTVFVVRDSAGRAVQVGSGYGWTREGFEVGFVARDGRQMQGSARADSLHRNVVLQQVRTATDAWSGAPPRECFYTGFTLSCDRVWTPVSGVGYNWYLGRGNGNGYLRFACATNRVVVCSYNREPGRVGPAISTWDTLMVGQRSTP
jgi:hypothetical protein